MSSQSDFLHIEAGAQRKVAVGWWLVAVYAFASDFRPPMDLCQSGMARGRRTSLSTWLPRLAVQRSNLSIARVALSVGS